MKELADCLDLAYHELRYLHGGHTVFASEAVRTHLTPELKREYYRDPVYRKQLNSVLRYAIVHGKKIIQFVEGKRKRHHLPKINNQPLNDFELELLVQLESRAHLGESQYTA